MLALFAVGYLAIGSLIWAVLLMPHGFGGAPRLHAAAASLCAILVWPLFVWAMVMGSKTMAKLEAERR